ncbi:MAG: stage III sporulation protein AE [Thermoanaerobacterales bacterium]|nr:stage III sporulation protein AE [Bacillota bacterium]MDI6906761.1 stage III sporulation protein AE [Thermoanaerobacterales bacterium]
MHKRCFFPVLLLLVWLFLPPASWAAGAENTGRQPAAAADGMLSELDLGKVDGAAKILEKELSPAVPEVSFTGLVRSLVRGEGGMGAGDILDAVLRYLFGEVAGSAVLLGKLVVLAVIGAVLQNVSSSFEKATAGRMAQAAVYLVLIVIALGSFTAALRIGREVIDGMVSFMHALLPVMITLLCAVGGLTTAALFHPAVVAAVNVTATLVKNIVFPLIFFSAILTMASYLASGFSVTRLADFFRFVGLGLMGLLTTVFLGVLAIQGVAGAVTEGIAFRTAKLATSTFIPVVGRVFADAMDAMVSSSLLVKNAVGMAGLLIVFLMVVFPLLKILSLVVVYKLAAALVQPLGEKNLADLMNALGNAIVSIFAVVGTAGILFFFALAIVTGLGNINVMLR